MRAIKLKREYILDDIEIENISHLPEGYKAVCSIEFARDNSLPMSSWYNNADVGFLKNIDISELRKKKIEIARSEANLELMKSDYKIIRHMAQARLHKSTSITEEEFANLDNQRQAIRDICNNKEEIINKSSDIDFLF